MKNRFTILHMIALALAVAAPGCATQRVLSLQDHETDPVTKLETVKTKKLLWWQLSAEHQYWLCQDQGKTLSCDLECGGTNDLVCPSATLGAGFSTSNVQ